MLRFILPILATDNITLNKGSNPHADRHNKTHEDMHTVKHAQSNSTVAQIQMSYVFAVATLYCFCFPIFEKRYRLKIKGNIT